MSLSDYQRVPQTGTVTIAAAASLSDALDLRGCNLVAIAMSAAWTAANLSFQGSDDGATYFNIYDDGGVELAVAAAAARYIVFDDDMKENMAGIRWIKIRSGTVALPVVQLVNDRVLTLIARSGG